MSLQWSLFTPVQDGDKIFVTPALWVWSLTEGEVPKSYRVFTHTKEWNSMPTGVFAAPGDMAFPVCFVNQLFINLGIPSDHASFLHKQCNSFDANSDGIYSWHHHALSNKNILKSWQLSNVHISWFVYHLVSLAKFTHTTEVNILLGKIL